MSHVVSEKINVHACPRKVSITKSCGIAEEIVEAPPRLKASIIVNELDYRIIGKRLPCRVCLCLQAHVHQTRGTRFDVPQRSARAALHFTSSFSFLPFTYTYTCAYVYRRRRSGSQTQAAARTRRDILLSARRTYITVPAVWVRGRAATFVVYSVYRTGVPYSDSSGSLACTSETGDDRAPPRARYSFSSCRERAIAVYRITGE